MVGPCRANARRFCLPVIGNLSNTPSGHRDRNKKFAGFLAGLRKYCGERITMLAAGFDNLSSKVLRNLDCFGDAAPFRYQPRNVGARAKVAAFFKRLNSDADRHFFNFRDVLLPLHARPCSSSYHKYACLRLLLRRGIPPAIPQPPVSLLDSLGHRNIDSDASWRAAEALWIAISSSSFFLWRL